MKKRFFSFRVDGFYREIFLTRFARYFGYLYALVLILYPLTFVRAQSLGNTGTIEGSVTDPSGANVAGAAVTLSNPVSGYTQTITTNATGAFRFVNIPPNTYHLQVKQAGFAPFNQDVAIRTSLPVKVSATL